MITLLFSIQSILVDILSQLFLRAICQDPEMNIQFLDTKVAKVSLQLRATMISG